MKTRIAQTDEAKDLPGAIQQQIAFEADNPAGDPGDPDEVHYSTHASSSGYGRRSSYSALLVWRRS